LGFDHKYGYSERFRWRNNHDKGSNLRIN